MSCFCTRSVMPSIIRSIFFCAAASASIWTVVSAPVLTAIGHHRDDILNENLPLDLRACLAASRDVAYFA